MLGGFGLALLSVVAGTIVAGSIDPVAFPDIKLVCKALGESGPECVAGTVKAGVVSTAGIVVAMLVTWSMRRALPSAATADAPHALALPLATASAAILGAAYLVAAIVAPPSLSRVAEISQHAALISIVNLGWPIILQLAAMAPDFRTRLGYLASLVALLCITPYRATVLAAAAFGIVFPALAALLSTARESSGFRMRTWSIWRWMAIAAGAIGVTAVAGAMILYQTAERTSPIFRTTVSAGETASSLALKLAQRIAYPIYQAHFAERLGETQALPSALDELASKLRLTRRENLNQQLYRRIYGPGTVGETTSLYYGEAAARTSLAPFAWVVAAPLLYVLAWVLLARMGVDVGILAGLAIWRGSLGGTFSVLPAFVLQVLIIWLLCRLTALRAPATASNHGR